MFQLVDDIFEVVLSFGETEEEAIRNFAEIMIDEGYKKPLDFVIEKIKTDIAEKQIIVEKLDV